MKLLRADPATRDELLRRLAQELGADPGVAFAFVHGSFLGPAGFHDVDVGVFLSGPDAGRASHLSELAERLSARVELPVDVRALNDAPVSFVFRVLQGRLLVSRRDDLLAEVIERTVPRYLDLEPLLRRATREAFAP